MVIVVHFMFGVLIICLVFLCLRVSLCIVIVLMCVFVVYLRPTDMGTGGRWNRCLL